MKKNRDMLGKTKRVPFDKSGYGARSGTQLSVDTEPVMSEKDRITLVKKIKSSERRDIILQLALLGTLIALAIAALIGSWTYLSNW